MNKLEEIFNYKKLKIREIIEKNNPVGKTKFSALDKEKKFNFYKIPIDLLILNPNNSRFETYISSLNKELDLYSMEGQKEIKELIWNQNISKNKKTLTHIKENTQQIPAVITCDGVLVSGNRRAAIIMKNNCLNSDETIYFLDCIVLNEISFKDKDKIKDLELKTQFSEDEKLDYSRLNKMLQIYYLKKNSNKTDKEILSLFKFDQTDMNMIIEQIEFIKYFLKFIGKENELIFAEGLEDHFKTLIKFKESFENNKLIFHGWLPKKYDFEKLEETFFKSIYFKPEGKIIREIFSTKKNQKNIFSFEDQFNEFYNEIDDFYINNKDNNSADTKQKMYKILNEYYLKIQEWNSEKKWKNYVNKIQKIQKSFEKDLNNKELNTFGIKKIKIEIEKFLNFIKKNK